MKGSADRRINRTRKALREAMLRLAGTRDLASITIKELSDAADINRVTFYAHYRNVDELVEDILSGLVAEAESRLRSPLDPTPLNGVGIARLNLASALAALEPDAGFLAWALASPRGASLRKLLVASLKRVVRDRVALLGADASTYNAAVYLDYVSEGITGVLLSWLETGRREKIDRLADALSVALIAHPYDTLGIALAAADPSGDRVEPNAQRGGSGLP